MRWQAAREAFRRWSGWWSCVPLLLLLLAGCGDGPHLGRVSGNVRLDGSPLAEATVIFQPTPGGPASHGVTDASGRYELMYAEGQPGAVIGSHTVTVETYRIRLDESGEPVEVPEKLPARYNSQTELSREVAAGAQSFDFDLTSNE